MRMNVTRNPSRTSANPGAKAQASLLCHSRRLPAEICSRTPDSECQPLHRSRPFFSRRARLGSAGGLGGCITLFTGAIEAEPSREPAAHRKDVHPTRPSAPLAHPLPSIKPRLLLRRMLSSDAFFSRFTRSTSARRRVIQS